MPPRTLRLSSSTTDLLQPDAHGEVAISPGSAAKCPAVSSYPVKLVRLCFPSIDGPPLQRRALIRAGLGLSVLGILGSAPKAQAQSGSRRIGLLIARPEADPDGRKHLAAFERGLSELGWTVGPNVEINTRWEAPQAATRLTYVRELVALKPDVLVINSTAYLRIAQPEVGGIAVVFVAIADPVAQGFVQSPAWARNGWSC